MSLIEQFHWQQNPNLPLYPSSAYPIIAYFYFSFLATGLKLFISSPIFLSVARSPHFGRHFPLSDFCKSFDHFRLFSLFWCQLWRLLFFSWNLKPDDDLQLLYSGVLLILPACFHFKVSCVWKLYFEFYFITSHPLSICYSFLGSGGKV